MEGDRNSRDDLHRRAADRDRLAEPPRRLLLDGETDTITAQKPICSARNDGPNREDDDQGDEEESSNHGGQRIR
jgi:hypothetical protein